VLKPLVRSLALLGASLGCLAAEPPAAPDPVPAPRYALPETEEWNLATEDGSRSYRILVYRPQGAAPPDGHPVLTVLDGNALFAGLVDAARATRYEPDGPKGLMVVAVGYPGDAAYDMRRRSFDLTPAPSAAARARGRPPVHALGGQREFLDFLLHRLRGELARRYPVDATRQSLYGHSFGGAFALYALYQRPEAFQAVVAASPSIWWNGQSVLQEEAEFSARIARKPDVPLQTSLRILVGGREPGPMVGDATALAARMAGLSARGLRSSLRVLPEESHMSMPAAAATDVLRFVATAP